MPERKDADANVFLQSIIDRCNTISRSAATRKVLRAARPAIEGALASAGIPLNLDELGDEPRYPAARTVLALPLTLAQQVGKRVVFFLDELQRAVAYTDGEEILQALVDIYSGVSDVVVLVDGSEERALTGLLGQPVQLDKLCGRVAVSPHIPKERWRERLPERFDHVGMTITSGALAAIIDFGAERPYETMAAAQGAALTARALGGEQRESILVDVFEADQGIEVAKRRDNDDA